ncbi:hypothetical protein PGT21_010696 [Puccinia graminis f. sp. tritici]|uniref:Uncharacterized protein n=1 Tax=Puccinia graminis f. sp. tritici TaxID=56615 RepID=A0A5B0PJL1_PUCGR|nr:hypothetical protein PGT21_010696 [Puccinia graminis f. sp. tritici]
MSSSERLLPTTARDGDRLRHSYSACRCASEIIPGGKMRLWGPTLIPPHWLLQLIIGDVCGSDKSSKQVNHTDVPQAPARENRGWDEPFTALRKHGSQIFVFWKPGSTEPFISNGKSLMVLLSYLNLLSKRSQRRLGVPTREAMSSLRKGRAPVAARPMDLATQATSCH